MSIVANGNTIDGETPLEIQIKALRADAALRDSIARAKDALRDQLAFSSAREALPQYENVIKSALHHLARNHLQDLVKPELAPGDKGVIVLSYSSRYASRVADFESPDPLDDPEGSLATHVGAVIEHDWKRALSKIPGMFELHRLAQCRINLQGSPPTRLPIYVSATAKPQWLGLYDLASAPGFAIKTTNRSVDAALFELGDISDDNDLQRRFIGFVEGYRNAEETKRCYPSVDIAPDKYAAYVIYLKKLLAAGAERLCLCTVAISDELSNVALGTAMLFTTVPLRPVTAAAVHAVCFELFNALHMVEARADERHKTASMVAHWVHHEAQHWATQMKGIASCLVSPARLEDTPDEPDEPDAVRPLLDQSELAAELKALADVVPMTTELLRQLNRDITKGIGPQKFTESIQTIFSAIAKQDGYATVVDVDGDWNGNVPYGLVPVALELVRNAVRYRVTTGGNKHIAVALKESGHFLCLRVSSEPQLRLNLSKIESLNAIDETEHLELGTDLRLTGSMLVKRIVRILGGDVHWQARSRADGQLVVTATCNIPVPDPR